MNQLDDNKQSEDRQKPWLPPLVGAISDGKVTWQGIKGVDFELLGYFLSCHLVIEHYMDEFLKATYPMLSWEAAKPTFTQRVALLTDMRLPDRFNCIPAIKHMNTIRNKLSHRIEFKIDAEALLPLQQYVQKASKQALQPLGPKELLEHFTSLCCATFAGSISMTVHQTNYTRR
ncbi:hypothetical protein ACFOY5_11950 [Massilia aurea]|uniref:hypothetical protein n=1 Tax=Massilia aurea TaxID=373040 RepID=UPI002161564C|nr:hypothetical protein [Massilia aurea]MCS0709232.1 hypothetical protein [Massilia aurea]